MRLLALVLTVGSTGVPSFARADEPPPVQPLAPGATLLPREVPPPPPPSALQRSGAMAIGGFVTAGVGLTTALAGVIAIVAAPQEGIPCLVPPCPSMPDPNFVVAGIASMAVGGALLGIGLPVGIVGATRMQSPRISIGPSGGAVSFSF